MRDQDLDGGIARMNGKALRFRVTEALPRLRGQNVSDDRMLEAGLRAINLKYGLPDDYRSGFVPKNWTKRQEEDE